MLVYIKPTEYCNLNCSHCYNEKQNTVIDFKKLISFCTELNNRFPDNYFILHGGEPLLFNVKRILDLVNMFENQWRITTNLVYDLDLERLDILSKMDDIRTSFDPKIRFTNKTFEVWKNNVKELLENDFPLTLNVCLTKYLLEESPYAFLSFVKGLGFKNLRFERLTRMGRALENEDIFPKYEEVDEWLCKLYEESKNFDITNHFFKDIELAYSGNFSNCRAHVCQKMTFTINSDGTIGECPNSAHTNVIGTLDDNLDDLLKIKMNHACTPNTKCLQCNLFHVCRGECEQLEWQEDTCPFPKKLYQLIKRDFKFR